MKKKTKSSFRKTSKTVDRTQDVVQALEELMRQETVSSGSMYGRDFANIIRRLQDDTFCMAVVGEFSSGKSTFLNALIGRDILKHGARETTATITEIENASEETEDPRFDVYYENGKREENIPLELLAEYTATASTTHEVAREIQKVVIKSRVIESDYPIRFIDTPGLNGMADLHREKTIEQIKNSHACIYLMQVRGLGKSDIEFLKFITQYQHNILFLQNFIDELKELEGETPEGKINRQRELIEENLCGDGRTFTYKILPISARKALIARDEAQTEYEGLELTDALRGQLYRESGFEAVVGELTNLMESNHRKDMQRRDSVAVALELLGQLRRVVSLQNDMEKAAWEDTPEARRMRGYGKILEELKAQKENYRKQLLDYIEAESGSIRRDLRKKQKESLREVEVAVRGVLEKKTTEEEIQDYLAPGQLPRFLSEQIFQCESECDREMGIRFENLIRSALLRIEKFTGDTVSGKTDAAFSAGEAGVARQHRSFAQEESDIRRMEQEITQKEAELRAEQADARLGSEKIDKLRKELEDLRREVDRRAVDRARQVNNLGDRPKPETKYRDKISYEERGGFGIMDRLFGPKKVIRQVSYQDYSRQQAWDSEKARIESEYLAKKKKMNAEGHVLSRKIDELQDKISQIERLEPVRQKEISSMQQMLLSKRRNLEVQKKAALQEYLRILRNDIMEHVREYLQGEVAESMEEALEEAVNKNREKAASRILELFEASFAERIRSLEALCTGRRDENRYRQAEETLQVIDRAKKVMEEYLCQT